MGLAGWGSFAPAGAQTPDPRDAVIYFAMTDRFADGDPVANTALGDARSSAYDPSRDDRFHGGDVRGVLQHLDYIQGLGATAVWLTPPVLNASWNLDSSFTGYHGYWARDFATPDPRFGSWDDWRALSTALHARGMGLIQDMVVNHTADFFSIERGAYDPLPLAPPFDLNNPDVPAHRSAGIYHWTPEIRDYGKRRQVLTHALSGLDDLNTRNPAVREALRSAYGTWMRELALDGIRFDTQKYVERGFWPDFLWAGGEFPGMERLAADAGRPLFTFGEVWNESGSHDVRGERYIRRYLGRRNYRGVDACLNFPLAGTLRAVFARGASVEDLAYRIEAQTRVMRNPTAEWVHFLDNHDMPRFRAEGSEAAFRQAMRTLLLFPGAVAVYAGTEQGDREVRANLFGRLDAGSEAYTWMQAAFAARAATVPWRRAWPEVVVADAQYAGLLVLRSVWEGDTVWTVLNATEDPRAFADVRAPGMRAGTAEVVCVEGAEPVFEAAANEFSWLYLPPRAWMAFRLAGDEVPARREEMAQAWSVNGTLQPFEPVKLSHGSYEVVRWNTDAAGIPVGVDTVERFRVVEPRRTVVRARDPRGDDRGRDGKLTYPTSEGFAHRGDVRGLRVVERGATWEVEVRLRRRHSRVWNPPAGFDHVEVGVWFAVSGGGMKELPGMQASWEGSGGLAYGFRASGWQLVAWDAGGAAPPPKFLGARGRTLRWEMPKVPGCAAVWVTTWDADGMGVPRPVQAVAGPYEFGGGGADSPRIVDDLHGHVR